MKKYVCINLKRNFPRVLLSFFLSLCCGLSIDAQVQNLLTGQVKCNNNGISNVMVTNGFDCVLTDFEGKYSLPYNRDARFLYLTTPAGYLPKSKGSTPIYYEKIKADTEIYDFSLLKNTKDDNKHLFIAQADVQLFENGHIDLYSEYINDIKSFLEKEKREIFVLDCGDIVGNTPALYPSYVETSDALGVPFYRAIGNHDMDTDVRSYEHSYKTFEEYFGPIYYSFNRGKAHYIILNNCFYVNRHYRYIGYIDEKTLQWIETDLSFVPKDHLVFVAMHIPTSLNKEIRFNTVLSEETNNAFSLHDVLKGYDAHIISGHTHNNINIVFNEKLMEHNTGAVCGAFWKADICTDGTPKGCSVYEVDGNKVTWRYKSMGNSVDFQFKCYPAGFSSDYPQDVIANVWNWDENWKVELYENEEFACAMKQFEAYDLDAKIICSDKEKMVYQWISPSKTNHLFKAQVKNKNAKIEVRVTDRFGRVYKQEVK